MPAMAADPLRWVRGHPARGDRRKLAVFVGVAVLVLIVIGLAAGFSRTIARNEALADAERTTTRLAELVVAPCSPTR